MGATALSTGERGDPPGDGLIRGYIDVRGQNPAQLESHCQKLATEGRAEHIRIVSLGDEIGLETPPGRDSAGFRGWLQAKGLKPADVDPDTEEWEKIVYNSADRMAKEKPGTWYYSQLYRRHYGIQAQKQLTDAIRRRL